MTDEPKDKDEDIVDEKYYTMRELSMILSPESREQVENGQHIPIPRGMYAHLIHKIRSCEIKDKPEMSREQMALIQIGALLLACERFYIGDNSVSCPLREAADTVH